MVYPLFNEALARFSHAIPYFMACFSALIAVEIVKVIASRVGSFFRKDSPARVPLIFDQHGFDGHNFAPKKAPEEAPRPTFETNLAALEEKRNSKIIFLCSKKSTSLFDLSNGKGFNMGVAEEFVTTLRKVNPIKHIDIILNLPGGSFAATEVIVNAILNHDGSVNIHVPFQAQSGATLLCLAADNVYPGKNCFFGPFDSQVYGLSIPTVARYIPEGPGYFGLYDMLRDYCRKDAERTRALLTKMGKFIDIPQVELLESLSNGSLEHDTPIFQDSLLGKFPNLHTHVGIDPEIYDIYDQYCEKNSKSSGGGGLLGQLF